MTGPWRRLAKEELLIVIMEKVKTELEKSGFQGFGPGAALYTMVDSPGYLTVSEPSHKEDQLTPPQTRIVGETRHAPCRHCTS